MLYYLVGIALTILLCLYMSRTYYSAQGVLVRKFKTEHGIFVAIMPLALLALLRWNVGADSLYKSAYWVSYHAAAKGMNDRGFEIGFFWFLRVLSFLKLPYFWVLFVHECVFLGFVCCAINKGSTWVPWSIALFFLTTMYFDSYSSLRQSLAEAISLLGWAIMGEDNNEKKNLKVAGLFLVAGMFHYTALLNIPVYLFSKIRFKNQRDLYIITIIVVALSPVLQKAISAIMTLITGSKYNILGVARVNILISGVLCFLCWVNYGAICKLSRNAYLYANQSLLIFLLMLNSGAMFLPYRVFDMLKVGYIFIIPMLICSIKNKKQQWITGVLIGGIFVATFINYITLPENPIAKYQTVFNDFWNCITAP